jgi:hypothetical protein
MVYNRFNNPPAKDTGWGLIFRLNGLMNKIESDIDQGDIEKWNLHIDRIYANIIFKNPAEIIYDDKRKILDIKFSDEDVHVFKMFAERIKRIKHNIRIEKFKNEASNSNISRLNEILYGLIFKKDIWLRKKMFDLKLYLKEAEHDPRKAIYGGSG